MLGDIIDDMKIEIDRMNQVDCLNKANASPQITQLDAQVHDVAVNWQPTGYFTPDDIRKIVAQTTVAFAAARVAVASAPNSTSDAEAMKREANRYLDQNTTQGQAYIDAAAKAGTVPVDAPALKKWVLSSMLNVQHAYTLAAVLNCRVTWLETGLSYIAAIGNVVKRIAGVAVQAGEVVLKATETLFKMGPLLKWTLVIGGVGLAGTFLWALFRRYQRRIVAAVGPAEVP